MKYSSFYEKTLFVLADKENGPRTVNNLKLINAGKILESNMTLVESKLPVDLPRGVITMHVVVHPPLSEKNAGNYLTKYFCLNSTYLYFHYFASIFGFRLWFDLEHEHWLT